MTVCPLCRPQGEDVVWHDAWCRVIIAPQPDYPGFCRVIWQAHVKEMTDLTLPQRTHIMNAVWAVETALRDVLAPTKINLASLGNQVPHLHWHVIPRFTDDAHFPDAVWATPRRVGSTRVIDRAQLAAALEQRLAAIPPLTSAD